MIAAIWAWVKGAAIAVLATLPGALAEIGTYQGYVEGEYVRVGLPEGGVLDALLVDEGDVVAAGAALFRLDDARERAARDAAASRLAEARYTLADQRKGMRDPEIESLRASKREAEADLRLAKAELERQRKLFAQGFVSKEKLDDAEAAAARAAARVQRLAADIEAGQLAARTDRIAAAEAAVAAAEAALAEAEWQLARRGAVAPAAGRIVDTLYRPGEFVGAGQPVVTLLPPGNVKLRFFLPETRVGAARVGDRLRATCDGCPAPIDAAITFIADEAEFTPPTIFSESSRAKLVFRIEAHTLSLEDARGLHPGQPIDVAVEK